MKDQIEILDEIIAELEQNIDSEDLDTMYNLRDKLERENRVIDNELFRFATEPLIRRYSLNVDFYNS